MWSHIEAGNCGHPGGRMYRCVAAETNHPWISALMSSINTVDGGPTQPPILPADRHCARYKLSYRIVSEHLRLVWWASAPNISNLVRLAISAAA